MDTAQPSFVERTAQRLAEESRGPQTEAQPATAPTGTPDVELESAGDGYPDESIPGEAQEAEGEYESEAPEGTPDDDYEDEATESDTNWQSRYEEGQRKISEITENRQVMEQEHADMMATNLHLKHDLEDKFTEATRYAENYLGGFNQQIAGMEHAFQSGQIEPDNLPGARQQYQNLINQRNGMANQVEQIKAQQSEAEKVMLNRQAEISRIRLNRTIPNWGREKHQELGEYAQSRGYSPDEFGKSMDYRFFELLNDSMMLNRAGDTVQKVKRAKTASGPSRNARQQPRSADGKYKQARKEFLDNPNQRGRFADMKAAELRKERKR